MIRTKDLRKKNLTELKKMLKDLEFEYVKASSQWGKNLIDRRKAGVMKGIGTQGEKTSLLKGMRKLRSKLITLIKEKDVIN